MRYNYDKFLKKPKERSKNFAAPDQMSVS